MPRPAQQPTNIPRDPFFGSASAPTQPVNIDPFGLLDNAPPRPAPTPANAELVHGRTMGANAQRLETYQTRTLVLGLIKLFQRRGIIGPDELQRLLANLVESGELKDTDKLG